MTRHMLDEVLDRKAGAAPPPRLPATTALGVREIPRMCSCTWRPDYSTLPATWTLTRPSAQCKIHGENGDAQ